MKNLKKVLATIAYNEPWTIRACVAKEALSEGKEYIVNFFSDLAHWGCVSGMVSSLVWYSDTHRFFDTYYDEIMGIVEDLADQGIKIECTGGDLKNKLAWLAFEEEAWKMANDDLRLGF